MCDVVMKGVASVSGQDGATQRERREREEREDEVRLSFPSISRSLSATRPTLLTDVEPDERE